MAKVDLYQVVTDRVIEAMEKGTMPWQRGWKNAAAPINMPRRHNGEFYRGINVLILWSTAIDRGFKSDTWMTFNQAKAEGGMVRKGEKGTAVVYFKFLEKEKENGDKDKIPFLRQFTVFNVDQIDGLPAKFHASKEATPVVDTGARPLPEIEAFFAATGMRIVTKGNQPCYRPFLDVVEMPAISQFNGESEYYGTLAHEGIHWTGHESRLDRIKVSDKKTEYAFEELVAEMGALYTCSHLDVTPDFSNSAAYLNSWLAALKNDKKFIFQAASAAQKACDFLLEKGGRKAAQAA